jgi:hypothetical protein
MVRRACLLLAVPVCTLVAQAPGVRLPGWNVAFLPPPGWHLAQISGRAAGLTDTLDSGALFIAAAVLDSTPDAVAELRLVFEDLRYDATPVAGARDTTLRGRRALLAVYRGTPQAATGPVEAHVVTVFGSGRTGALVLGFAPSGRSDAVARAVLLVAATLDVGPLQRDSALAAGLAGRWRYARTDSSAGGQVTVEEVLEFDGRERFSRRTQTVVAAARLPGVVGTEPEEDGGTYLAVGASLVLLGRRARRTLDVRLDGDRLTLGARAFRRLP